MPKSLVKNRFKNERGAIVGQQSPSTPAAGYHGTHSREQTHRKRPKQRKGGEAS